MNVNTSDLGRRLQCPSCHKIFQSQAIRTEQETAPAEPRVTTLPCDHCQNQFAISHEMIGRLVACPFCNGQMRVPSSLDDSAAGPLPPTQSPSKTRFKFTAEPDLSSVESDVTEQDSSESVVAEDQSVAAEDQSNGALEQLSDPTATDDPRSSQDLKATELTADDLPPRYEPAIDPVAQQNGSDTAQDRVDESAEQLLPPQYRESKSESELVSASLPVAKESFAVETHVTRVESAEGIVEVRALSRQEKTRRRRIRVAIVAIVSIAILLVVFYLLNPSGN